MRCVYLQLSDFEEERYIRESTPLSLGKCSKNYIREASKMTSKENLPKQVG
jgi:hypothetical protein